MQIKEKKPSMSEASVQPVLDITSAVKDILDTIEREREREIIARRFGLYDRRETLEQIGELLGITRERVRQLEKAIMIRLKIAAEDSLPHVEKLEKLLVRNLYDLGGVARISDLAVNIDNVAGDRERAHLAFVAEL